MNALAGLVVAVSLAACTESATTPDPSTALPADAHFVARTPDGSPEKCIANSEQPYGCILSLSLCKSGRAGLRIGDIVAAGAYDMVGSVAHASFTDGSSLAFDVEALVDLDAPDYPWIVDTEGRWQTLQFDNIDCSR